MEKLAVRWGVCSQRDRYTRIIISLALTTAEVERWCN